jgi:hypothetical protein
VQGGGCNDFDCMVELTVLVEDGVCNDFDGLLGLTL